jgi:hypothetical protein
MSPKVLLFIVALAATSGVIAYKVQESKGGGAKFGKVATPSHAGPPADALYLDVGPAGVLAAARSKDTSALDEVLGHWNGPTGWQGAVEAIVTYRGEEALRLTEYDSTVIGGSYTIIAIVGEGHGTSKGKTVHVQGRVASAKAEATRIGMVNQIVLEDARIVK